MMRNPYQLDASFRMAALTTTLRIVALLVLIGGAIGVVYAIVASHTDGGPQRAAAALSLGVPVVFASALFLVGAYCIDLLAELVDAIKLNDEEDGE